MQCSVSSHIAMMQNKAAGRCWAISSGIMMIWLNHCISHNSNQFLLFNYCSVREPRVPEILKNTQKFPKISRNSQNLLNNVCRQQA